MLIDSHEIEKIKAAYLGGASQRLNRSKQKSRMGGDKFRQVFKEDWDASEDTSVDHNPLYAHRKDPNLLFGRGFVAGVDQDAQKKQLNSKKRMDTAARNFA